MRAILVAVMIISGGCSHEEMRQAHEDARKLGSDLKKQFKSADAVVTKEAREAREKVKEGAARVKRDVQNQR